MKLSFFDTDFETRSEVDIFEEGAYKYATHPSTEILIIGYSFDLGETIEDYDPFFSPISKLKKFLRKVKKAIAKGKKLRAFNSMFEFLIWNHVGVRQFGFPELKLSQTYCVMAESCAMGHPASLEKCALALRLQEKKDKEGKALINFFSVPSAKEGELFRSPLDHEKRFRRFKKYCRQDVKVQIDVSNRYKKLTAKQYTIFQLTERMNLRGLPVDRDMIESATNLDIHLKTDATTKIKALTKGEILAPTQSIALRKWLNNNGCNIPNLKAPTVAEWLEKLDPDNIAYKALQIRVEGSKSSIAKFFTAQNYITPSDYVHDFLKYHIATTGRWGGRGIQIQNFSKPDKNFKTTLMKTIVLPNGKTIKEVDQEQICNYIATGKRRRLQKACGSIGAALKAVTRGMICAPKGYKLIAADYAQIEARVVMWLANCRQGLADFAGDGRIYEHMASSIFGIPHESILKPSFQRDVGKETVLGAGFGMGFARFIQQCLTRGIVLPEALAKKAIDGYRAKYQGVKKSWKECENKAVSALANPGKAYAACNGRLVYRKEGEHLFAYLPSGRCLCYPNAYVVNEVNDWGYTQAVIYYYKWINNRAGDKWVPNKTWGGTLFQNAVQAIAADIMAEGMLIAERAGYRSIFTVHDEAVALVEDTDKFTYQQYEKLLADHLPEWANGLLIIAEGWEGKRYRK